jgi:hypothetical protein
MLSNNERNGDSRLEPESKDIYFELMTKAVRFSGHIGLKLVSALGLGHIRSMKRMGVQV